MLAELLDNDVIDENEVNFVVDAMCVAANKLAELAAVEINDMNIVNIVGVPSKKQNVFGFLGDEQRKTSDADEEVYKMIDANNDEPSNDNSFSVHESI